MFRRSFHFLSRDYFVQPGDFAALTSTAVILEGLALYVVVAALCQVDTDVLRARAAHAGARRRRPRGDERRSAGGNPASQPRRHRGAARNLRSDCESRRRSRTTSLPDRTSRCAGWRHWASPSHRAERRLAWVAVGVPLIAAIYLTGSRSVIAAALVGLVVLGFIGYPPEDRGDSRRRDALPASRSW